MNTLKRIFAATDFSGLGNDAACRAAPLAARENAELLIVHAFPRQSALETAFADPDLAGLGIAHRIVHGDPNPALPDAIRELDADLIVVGRQGGWHLGEAVMGSVSRFLAYYAPCDVLVA